MDPQDCRGPQELRLKTSSLDHPVLLGEMAGMESAAPPAHLGLMGRVESLVPQETEETRGSLESAALSGPRETRVQQGCQVCRAQRAPRGRQDRGARLVLLDPQDLTGGAGSWTLRTWKAPGCWVDLELDSPEVLQDHVDLRAKKASAAGRELLVRRESKVLQDQQGFQDLMGPKGKRVQRGAVGSLDRREKRAGTGSVCPALQDPPDLLDKSSPFRISCCSTRQTPSSTSQGSLTLREWLAQRVTRGHQDLLDPEVRRVSQGW